MSEVKEKIPMGRAAFWIDALTSGLTCTNEGSCDIVNIPRHSVKPSMG